MLIYINFSIYMYLWSIYLFEYTFYCCLFIVLSDGFLKSILCTLYFDHYLLLSLLNSFLHLIFPFSIPEIPTYILCPIYIYDFIYLHKI